MPQLSQLQVGGPHGGGLIAKVSFGVSQVALMVAGVSTGALVGAFTAFLFSRTLASQRREAPWMEEVPVDALVPWVPSKARCQRGRG